MAAAYPEALPPLEAVSQLTQPKHIVLKDELSGRAATLCLTLGELKFYYASADAAALDYATLRHVAPLLASVKAEQEAGGSTHERAIHAANVRALTGEVAATCGALAAERNRAGAYDTASPAALRCLRALVKLHGEGVVQLVPAYLALADAGLGQGPTRFSQASEFLFTASSILLTTARAAAAGGGGSGAAAHSALHARLQLGYGRLYLAQGKLGDAAEAAARAVYHAALAGGPEHLGAAPGYALLGRALRLQGAALGGGAGVAEKEEAAGACFDKAAEVVLAHLARRAPAFAAAVGYAPPPRPPPGSVDAAEAASPPGEFTVAEDHEAGVALAAVARAREELLGAAALPTADAWWAQAQLHAHQGRAPQARALADKAVDVFLSVLVRFDKRAAQHTHTKRLTYQQPPPLNAGRRARKDQGRGGHEQEWRGGAGRGQLSVAPFPSTRPPPFQLTAQQPRRVAAAAIAAASAASISSAPGSRASSAPPAAATRTVSTARVSSISIAEGSTPSHAAAQA